MSTDQPQGGESPTVETDAAKRVLIVEGRGVWVYVEFDFARSLERQRDAALAELERARKDTQDLRNRDNYRENLILEIRGERDQLRADLAAAREERDAARRHINDAAPEIKECPFCRGQSPEVQARCTHNAFHGFLPKL